MVSLVFADVLVPVWHQDISNHHAEMIVVDSNTVHMNGTIEMHLCGMFLICTKPIPNNNALTTLFTYIAG